MVFEIGKNAQKERACFYEIEKNGQNKRAFILVVQALKTGVLFGDTGVHFWKERAWFEKNGRSFWDQTGRSFVKNGSAFGSKRRRFGKARGCFWAKPACFCQKNGRSFRLNGRAFGHGPRETEINLI